MSLAKEWPSSSPSSSYTATTLVPSRPISPTSSKLEFEFEEEPVASYRCHQSLNDTISRSKLPTAAPRVYTRDELLNLARSPHARLHSKILKGLQEEFPEVVMNRQRRRGLIARNPEWKAVPSPKREPAQPETVARRPQQRNFERKGNVKQLDKGMSWRTGNAIPSATGKC